MNSSCRVCAKKFKPIENLASLKCCTNCLSGFTKLKKYIITNLKCLAKKNTAQRLRIRKLEINIARLQKKCFELSQ